MQLSVDLVIIALFLDIYLAPILAALSFKAMYRMDGTYKKSIGLKMLPLAGIAIILFKIWVTILEMITMNGAFGSMLQLVLFASYGLVFIRFMYANSVKYILNAIRALAILTLFYIGITFLINFAMHLLQTARYDVFSNGDYMLTYGSYVLAGGSLLLFAKRQIKMHIPENERRKPFLPKKRLALAIIMTVAMLASMEIVHQDIVSVNLATLASPHGILAQPSEYGGYSPYNPGFANVVDERYYRKKLTGPDVDYLLDETGESYLRQSWASFLSWGVLLMLVVMSDRLRKLAQEKNISSLPYNMILWSLPFSSLYIHQLMYSLLRVVNGQLSILLAGGIACLAYGKAKFVMENGRNYPLEAGDGQAQAEPVKAGVSQIQ